MSVTFFYRQSYFLRFAISFAFNGAFDAADKSAVFGPLSFYGSRSLLFIIEIVVPVCARIYLQFWIELKRIKAIYGIYGGALRQERMRL